MTTFNYITKKIINTDNNFFSPNYDNSDTVNPIFKILFYGFVNNNTYTTKFNVSLFSFYSKAILCNCSVPFPARYRPLAFTP